MIPTYRFAVAAPLSDLPIQAFHLINIAKTAIILQLPQEYLHCTVVSSILWLQSYKIVGRHFLVEDMHCVKTFGGGEARYPALCGQVSIAL